MSDLLKEMIDLIGVEFLVSGHKENQIQDSIINMDFCEQKVFPDFDHVTVI